MDSRNFLSIVMGFKIFIKKVLTNNCAKIFTNTLKENFCCNFDFRKNKNC